MHLKQNRIQYIPRDTYCVFVHSYTKRVGAWLVHT